MINIKNKIKVIKVFKEISTFQNRNIVTKLCEPKFKTFKTQMMLPKEPRRLNLFLKILI